MSTAQNLNGKTEPQQPGKEDLQAQIDLLREEISRLTSMTSTVTKAEAKRAAAKLKAKGADVREMSEEQLLELRKAAEGYGEDAVRYVKEQPVNALGIAAGVGFVLGFLLTSRR